MRAGTPPGRWGYSVALRSRGLIAALEEFAPTVIVIHDALAFPGAIAAVGVPARRAGRRHVPLPPRRRDGRPAPGDRHDRRRRSWSTSSAGRWASVIASSSRRRRPGGGSHPTSVPRSSSRASASRPCVRACQARSGAARAPGAVGPAARLCRAPVPGEARHRAARGACGVAGLLHAWRSPGRGSPAPPIGAPGAGAGVAERVHMLGHLGDRDALAALLATADCFVHPNANEPFGLAPLEAAVGRLPGRDPRTARAPQPCSRRPGPYSSPTMRPRRSRAGSGRPCAPRARGRARPTSAGRASSRPSGRSTRDSSHDRRCDAR